MEERELEEREEYIAILEGYYGALEGIEKLTTEALAKLAQVVERILTK